MSAAAFLSWLEPRRRILSAGRQGPNLSTGAPACSWCGDRGRVADHPCSRCAPEARAGAAEPRRG